MSSGTSIGFPASKLFITYITLIELGSISFTTGFYHGEVMRDFVEVDTESSNENHHWIIGQASHPSMRYHGLVVEKVGERTSFWRWLKPHLLW